MRYSEKLLSDVLWIDVDQKLYLELGNGKDQMANMLRHEPHVEDFESNVIRDTVEGVWVVFNPMDAAC